MAYNRTLQHFVSQQELATIWTSGISYSQDQLVINEDKIYKAEIAHTSDPSFASDLAAGRWVLISGASASGSKNYIANPDFETGADPASSSWTKATVTVNGTTKAVSGNITPTAASITTFSADNTASLAGSYSLLVGGSAISAGASFMTDAFTIDREDQAKVMSFSFYYEAVSGTMNFSGTTSNTWAVWIAEVDPTNTDTVLNWVQPAGVYNMTQGSGIGLASGTFQTSATGTKYRLAVVCINTTGSVSIKFDDFKLGPQTVVYGSPVTDWVSYTPTVSGFSAGTASTSRYSYRRVGDSIEIIGNVMAGGTGVSASGDFQFSLPSGLTFDSSKMYQNGHVIGVSEAHNSGNYRYGGSVISSGASTFKFSIKASDANGGNLVGANQPSTGWWNSSGDQFSFSLSAPITGWSSSVQMSNDTDTRVVAARAESSTTGTWAIAETTINYSTVKYDTHGSITTGASWNYKVPVSGYYRISASHEGSTSGATTLILRVRKNGTSFANGSFPVSAATSNIIVRVDGQNYFNAGDTIDIVSTATAAGTFVNNAASNVVQIERLSGPATIAASETVAFSGQRTAGNYSLNNSTQTITWTSVLDTHNAYSGTTYVVPVSGVYRVYAGVNFSAATNNTVCSINLTAGSTLKSAWIAIDSSNNNYRALSVSNIVRLNAGQTVSVSATSTSVATFVADNAGTNAFLIERIGS